MIPEGSAEHLIDADSVGRLARYMRSVGIDEPDIKHCFDSAGGGSAEDPWPDKISLEQYSRLFRSAMQRIQHMDRVLPMAAGLGSDHFEFMCFAAAGQSTFGESLRAIERYTKMLASLSGFHIEIRQRREVVQVTFVIRDKWLRSGRGSEYVFGAKTSALEVLASLMAWLIQHNTVLGRVSIDEPYSEKIDADKLRRVLGVSLEFNAPETAMYIDAGLLELPIMQDAISVAGFMQDPLSHLSRQLKHPASLSSRILSLFNRYKRTLSVEELVALFRLSPSTLYRRLKDEKSSYQKLKDQFRCTEAEALLRNRNLSTCQVAEKLGFNDTGSFIRAFRRWTGTSPANYRKTCVADLR